MNLGRISALITLILLVGFSFTPIIFAAEPNKAVTPMDPKFQILPDCKAWIFPSDIKNNPCGFTKLQELIVNVIKWLLYIIIPIGFCIVGWAGFKIMTSTGNSEAIHEAYGMIKIVVIGVLIAALSYIIITNVFNVLNVKVEVEVLK